MQQHISTHTHTHRHKDCPTTPTHPPTCQHVRAQGQGREGGGREEIRAAAERARIRVGKDSVFRKSYTAHKTLFSSSLQSNYPSTEDPESFSASLALPCLTPRPAYQLTQVFVLRLVILYPPPILPPEPWKSMPRPVVEKPPPLHIGGRGGELGVLVLPDSCKSS